MSSVRPLDGHTADLQRWRRRLGSVGGEPGRSIPDETDRLRIDREGGLQTECLDLLAVLIQDVTVVSGSGRRTPADRGRTIAAAQGSVVVIGSDGLVVLDAEAQPVRTLEESWPIGASGALPLRPINADPDARIAAFESPRQVAEAATSRRPDGALNPASWLLPAAIALLGTALLGRRRRARR